MREIRVKKTELLKTMRANREVHADIVEEAQEGFREAVIKRLDEMLKMAKQGKHVDLHLGLQVPDDHTDEYDTVIGMLEMDINEYVDLDVAQYRQWVQDDWGWRNQFLATNSAYSLTAASL